MSGATPALPSPAWLAPQQATLRAAYAAGRLPHGLLVHEAPGAGGEWLGFWAAQLVLCEHPDRAPCGSCRGCRRALARAHPDLLYLGLEEDSRQIRIEQVRDLSAELALTAHGGGYKVALVSPADAMNRFAANALLKTLEEPPPRTLLVLVVTQPSRLPATVLSRCQRLRVPAPARAQSLAWLAAVRGPGDWGRVLDVLGEAPLLAATGDPAELAAVGTEVVQGLQSLSEAGGDVVSLAERWARDEVALRLRCIENWLTERIRRAGSEGAFMTEVGAGPYLSGARPVLNIRELFGLVEEARELRATLDVPLNRGLALEALLRQLAR
ncbi:MAG: DNA polymerase III subunit delta' [Proteobacteria bacterium]|nr:DNA polymerase III subunit delta' [Pseudomonadota bacterium]